MIERYFVKGLTYSWAAPSPVEPPNRDGTIERSGLNAPPTLTYTGVDREVMYGETATPSTYGLTMNLAIPHRWLNYVLGRTAYVRSVNTDVLTGFMSGCWICSWTEGGHRRVGHIGTVESAPRNQPPNTTVKNAFANSAAMQHGTHIRGYNPADAWTFDEIQRVIREFRNPAQIVVKIMSLVTTANEFYSILMIRRGANDWVCGGKKKAHAHHRATIANAMA